MSGAGPSGEREKLRFFGRMTASISHEIKNKLAILKEEVGLINDLFTMAERGKALDLNRVKAIAARLNGRADAIDEQTKRLNRWAHSVDEERKTFDLRGPLELMTNISRRIAAMKRVELELAELPAQIQVTSDPFLAQNLFFLLLDAAVAKAGEGGKVGIDLADDKDCALITLTGTFKGDEDALPLGAEYRELVERLKARVTVIAAGPRVEFRLPKGY